MRKGELTQSIVAAETTGWITSRRNMLLAIIKSITNCRNGLSGSRGILSIIGAIFIFLLKMQNQNSNFIKIMDL